MDSLIITKISMKIITEEPEKNGIVAYASIIFDHALKINGLTVVINKYGRPVVRFPETENGVKLQYIVPLNDELRRYIDNKVTEHYYSLKNKLNKLVKK